ncbi:MAG: Mut7-C ubiquitin/RNAse domain-containing protein [Bacteroidetes bacterium]|nr:Mut7-C ubiquitin/RNAse domain-containing protein [Bacteroidota bacterium]
MPKTIEIRFYEELNDFLPQGKRKKTFPHTFSGNPTVKDIIEGLGVPHVEVDLILVNDVSVSFTHKPANADRLAVYPVFESLDISPVSRLRPEPLREPRFILDVHLGKLARLMRMTGFDCLYSNDAADDIIIRIAAEEKRIILTRDIGILKNGKVDRGYWIRNTNPGKQIREVIERFDLRRHIRSFSRCMHCSGILEKVEKAEIEHLLKYGTKKCYQDFYRCTSCGKLYWKGSHVERMQQEILNILK